MSRGGLWAERVGKRRAGGGVGGVEAEAGALRWVGGWAGVGGACEIQAGVRTEGAPCDIAGAGGGSEGQWQELKDQSEHLGLCSRLSLLLIP